jgi:hypothetical protein
MSNLRVFAVRFAKWLYLGAVAGILLPLVWGLCLDLYIMMPFRRFFLTPPGGKVEVQIMQDWAFGVIHMKIFGRVILYLDGRYARALRSVSSFPLCKTALID